jgi:hypothetical protein
MFIVGVKVAPTWRTSDTLPGFDQLSVWCRAHTGTFPGDSGAVAELHEAQKSQQGLAAVVATENGIEFAKSNDTTTTSDSIDTRYAPSDIANVAHRFGHAIFSAQTDPSILQQQAVLQDAMSIDVWAHDNCKGQSMQGP